MKKLLTLIILFISIGAYAQVDSTTYQSELNTRIMSPRMKRDSIYIQFQETAYWMYQYKGHFADSATLVSAHPSPVQGEYASVGNANLFLVNSSNQWVGLSGSGGGSGATDNITLDGDGGGDPYHIKDGGVSTAKIAANAVDSTKIAMGAIRSGEILDGEVSLNDLAANSVNSGKIVDGSVAAADQTSINQNTIIGRNDAGSGPRESLTASEVKALLAILLNDLSGVTITSASTGEVLTFNGSAWVDGQVPTAGIADNAVTSAKIPSNAITSDKINALAVTNAKIAADAVTTDKIATGAVQSSDILDLTIATVDLGADVVTGAKIPDNAIGNEHLQDNVITQAEIADNAVGVAEIDPTGGSEGQVIGISGGNPAWIAQSGGSGLSNAQPHTLFGNITGSLALPDDFSISALTDDNSPAAGEWLVMQNSAGQLRKVEADEWFQAATGRAQADADEIAYWNAGGNLSFTDEINLTGTNNVELFLRQLTNPFGSVTAGQRVLRLNDVNVVPSGTLGSGGLLYVQGTSLFFHNDAGTAVNLTAAASSTLGSLTDVDLTGQATNDVLVKSAGDWVPQQIQTANIADNAITSAKINTSAVTNSKIGADAVDAAKIADNAIGNEHLQDNAVNTNEIVNLAVTTGKIANNAVTSAKIPDNAVGTSEIANGSVAEIDLAPNLNPWGTITNSTTLNSVDITHSTGTYNSFVDPATNPITLTIGAAATGNVINLHNIDGANSANFLASGITWANGTPGSLDPGELAYLIYQTSSVVWVYIGPASGGTGDHTINGSIASNRVILGFDADEITSDIDIQFNTTTNNFQVHNEGSNPFGSGTPGQGVVRIGDASVVPVGTLGSGALIYASGTSVYGHTDDGVALDMTGRTLATNNQTGTSYTLALTDAGKMVTMSNAAAVDTVNIPTNSAIPFPVGTILMIQWANGSAAQTRIIPAVGVTFNAPQNVDSQYRILSAGNVVVVRKTATNTWEGWGAFEATNYKTAWADVTMGTGFTDALNLQYRLSVDNGDKWVEFRGHVSFNLASPATSGTLTGANLPAGFRPNTIGSLITGIVTRGDDDGSGNKDFPEVTLNTDGSITVAPHLNTNIDEGDIFFDGGKILIDQ